MFPLMLTVLNRDLWHPLYNPFLRTVSIKGTSQSSPNVWRLAASFARFFCCVVNEKANQHPPPPPTSKGGTTHE